MSLENLHTLGICLTHVWPGLHVSGIVLNMLVTFFPFDFSHYTKSTTWSDPCSRANIPLEQFQWDALPPGWEACIDSNGDLYYVK